MITPENSPNLITDAWRLFCDWCDKIDQHEWSKTTNRFRCLRCNHISTQVEIQQAQERRAKAVKRK